MSTFLSDNLTSTLKAILHSKRASIYYLEHCRIMQKDGRVLYLTESKNANLYWNIPIANTTVILLGIGTSITQAAIRMLASAGVLVGFSGNGGTPLISGVEVMWITPQNEYRPTEYMQGWMLFWFNESKRFIKAKTLQNQRINYIKQIWSKDRDLQQEGFYIDDYQIDKILNSYINNVKLATNVGELLLKEAIATKELYKFAAKVTEQKNFTRNHDNGDTANNFLNHGNYLAYGLAATCLWVLGISHSFAIIHGKTRRGALVFDIADLVKDAIVLPWAFICAKEQMTEQEFRQQLLQKFIEHKALDFMFEQVKNLALGTENLDNIDL